MKRLLSVVAVLFAATSLYWPRAAQAEVVFSIAVAPPPLPVYDQPPVPGPDYLWTPGYWAYGDDDYYWVPGAWTQAPEPGLLWTPGYWGYRDGYYGYNVGYWGPRVGFYGGVNYGFGYTGSGFYGGYWRGGSYYYNRSVVKVTNTTIINNTYTKTVVVNNNVSRVSYNGGSGGLKAVATPTQRQAFETRKAGVFAADQTKHQQLAAQNKDLRFSANQGRPSIAAVPRAASYSGAGVVRAKPAGASPPPRSVALSNAREQSNRNRAQGNGYDGRGAGGPGSGGVRPDSRRTARPPERAASRSRAANVRRPGGPPRRGPGGGGGRPGNKPPPPPKRG